VLWLLACQAHSLTAGLGGGARTSSADPSGTRPETFTGSTNSPFSAATDPPATERDIARENGHRWTRLVGYSIAEATRRARAAGYSGEIKVEELEQFDASCKDGTVCTFIPSRWELDLDDVLYLKVNRKVTIANPD
jgi:hypothetical protein